MEINLESSGRRILILGAGASVDYGLPVWSKLGDLIIKKIGNSIEEKYKYKKEMLEWLNKVGEHKSYRTIDECIRNESISSEYPEGDLIENELFSVMKDIFDKQYKENKNGWIRILNDKILENEEKKFDESLAFINFNYDDVLEKNFLIFSHLHPKERKLNKRVRLAELDPIKVIALYPHGKFSENQDKNNSQIIIKKETIKSHDKTYFDVVSCYEGHQHRIVRYSRTAFELYILGLGGGLKINLDKIDFSFGGVSDVHITIKNIEKKDEIVELLNKKYPSAKIYIYSSCEDLVKKCFNN